MKNMKSRNREHRTKPTAICSPSIFISRATLITG